ncbi:hypothetical protein RRG08_011839 [Elysia crispata]|uniref:Uncharacterized protein n=1 Tax=Elysia crispata TaxID=231223 RepID=A0AAE1AUP5_9GAST|nr:hypothetical protein RRG08_011839 [Elysia crispata]
MQIISFSRYGYGLYLSILTNRMMITATELTFYRTGSTSRLRTCPATSILRESSLLQSETITRSGSKSGDHHEQVSVYSERAGLAERKSVLDSESVEKTFGETFPVMRVRRQRPKVDGSDEVMSEISGINLASLKHKERALARISGRCLRASQIPLCLGKHCD